MVIVDMPALIAWAQPRWPSPGLPSACRPSPININTISIRDSDIDGIKGTNIICIVLNELNECPMLNCTT